MKHTRIRPFNTKDTYPEQDLDNDLCQAVVANGVVYIRGQIGQDLDTRENVGAGDLEAQTDKAMSNVKMLVEEAGGTLEDIVKVVVYLTDIRYRETVYRTMGKWLKGVFPVSTGVVVTALSYWHFWPASLASLWPSSVRSTSRQPVNRFFRFHSLWPWRTSTRSRSFISFCSSFEFRSPSARARRPSNRAPASCRAPKARP